MPHLAPTVVFIVETAAAILAAAILSRQCRKPGWLPGRLIARAMNAGHRDLTAWGMSQIAIPNDCACLDVGCGGGAAIRELARIAPNGTIYGIDYSEASVDVARKTNEALISLGRVDVQVATVSHLPFGDETFCLVTAIETVYYWPNLESDLREVARVLKPGGTALILAESYLGKRFSRADRLFMRLIGGTLLSAADHGAVLKAAGFDEVKVVVNSDHGWLCATGRKPAVAADAASSEARAVPS